jgi:hypothetical protein
MSHKSSPYLRHRVEEARRRARIAANQEARRFREVLEERAVEQLEAAEREELRS